MKHVFSYAWSLAMLLLVVVAAGCDAPRLERLERLDSDGRDGRVGSAKSALTAIDTRPGDVSGGNFGQDGTLTYGQVITVPAGDTILRSFGFEMLTVPATVVFRGEVYAWDGTKASGASLYESAAVSTSGPTQQTISFDTGELSLVAGNQYVVFATAAKDGGTDMGTWLYRDDNPYAGGKMVVSSSALAWTTVAWTDFAAGADASFAVSFEAPAASTTALASSSNPSVAGQSVTITTTVSGAAGTPSGTLTLKDGATVLSTSALDASGQASFTSTTLAVGTHSLTATYSGGGAYAGSSSALSQVVNKAATTTSLASSANPSVAGSSVTFTAAVAAVAPGTGIPTGTVTFKEGATVLGSGAVDGAGMATFSTAALTSASHDVIATYGGDTRFTTSGSNTVSQVVNTDTATVAVTSSANPSSFGGSVTFTATVTSGGSSGAPTGSINFRDGAGVLGTGMLNGAGVATFATSALSAGSHSISADYGGDTKHSAASGSLTQTVNIGASTTVSASLTNPSVFGQSVTFTAKVTGTGAIPSGTVTFLDGATALTSTTLNAAGQATFATTTLAVGSHAITVAYGGDSSFGPGTSNITTQTVNKAATTTKLISSSNPSIAGSPVTFTATVSTTAPGAGTASGNVTFKDGGVVVSTAALDGTGVATFTTSTLATGSHTITATYATTASFGASNSAAVTQVVNPDGVAATLVSSLSPSTFGTSVTFTATVTSVGPGGTPTGTVTFKDGATTIGTMLVDGTGVASLSTAALTGGAHTITAQYGGDAKHAAAAGTVAQSVSVAASSIGLGSSASPSVFGQSVTVTATVSSTAAGTPTGTVTFMDGATVLGVSAVGAAGTATFTVSTLSVATHPLKGVYSGDTNYGASTSLALSQPIGKASTSTALVSSSNPALVATSVTFTATVAVVAPGAGVRTGTVTFLDGAAALGIATVNAAGVATIAIATLPAGAHTITAEYGGDGSFTGSTSNGFAQNVSASAATILLTAAPTSSTFGESVTLTAKLAGTSGTPTGTVTFSDGTTELGTSPLDGTGVATLAVTSLTAGTHTLSARYSGSTTYAWVVGSVAHAVDKAKTSVAVTSSFAPSTAGANVTFTATVTSAAKGFTGSVELFDGMTSLGVAPIAGTAATFSTRTLAQGGHAIIATYKGDASFAASTSPAFTQTVKSALSGAPGDGPESDPAGAGSGDAAAPGACGCRVVSRSPMSGGALLALFGIALFAIRRRRR